MLIEPTLSPGIDADRRQEAAGRVVCGRPRLAVFFHGCCELAAWLLLCTIAYCPFALTNVSISGM